MYTLFSALVISRLVSRSVNSPGKQKFLSFPRVANQSNPARSWESPAHSCQGFLIYPIIKRVDCSLMLLLLVSVFGKKV